MTVAPGTSESTSGPSIETIEALLDVATDPVARARLGAASLARSADYDAAGATAEIESRYRIVAGRRSKP